MTTQYSISHNQVLREAKQLVRFAIKHGWMSYPNGTLMDAEGDPIPNIEPEDETSSPITPELCNKAFVLRDRGITLDNIAAICGVPRGSIAYIISRGHEDYLLRLRVNPNSTKESF
jgi:DNA-directed RNA polymerase specialized sigma24 family protein